MGVRVFISYRRSDNPHLAGRLQDRLADAFGDEHVFYDVESIPFGKDFRRIITDRLTAVDVVLALVGPGFSPDRLASPTDVVRLELATAFDLGKPVIPVLIDGTGMPPPSSLPPELEPLAYLHAAPLRPDPDFRPDCTRLITAIGKLTSPATPPPPPPPPPSPATSAGAAGPVFEQPTTWGPPPPPNLRSERRRRPPGGPSFRVLINRPGPAVAKLAFSPDGSILASAGGEPAVQLWDPGSGGHIATVGLDSEPVDLAFPIWPRHLAAGEPTANSVEILDPLLPLRRLRLDHPDAVRSIAYSPNGALLASGCADGGVRVWEQVQGGTARVRRLMHDHLAPVVAVAFSPDGRVLATADSSAPGTVRLWAPASGLLLQSLHHDQRAISAVGFSPGGRLLASASVDGTIVLWSVADWRPVRTIRGSRQAVRRLAFSPDGFQVASSATDAKVRLWDLGTGQRVAELAGHSVAVRDIAFSPDGSMLATCGGAWNRQDRSEVFLWDLREVG